VRDKHFNVTACIPADLRASERAACVCIVQQGSAVDPGSAAYEVPRASLIAVLRLGTQIVGVGAIKRTRKRYASDIARLSHYSFDPETLELGYVAIDETHRGKHLSHKIIAALLSNYQQPLFATTSNARMKRALTGAGFERKGKEWSGNTGKLSLWLRI
jgi:hypothetical protein